MTEPAFRGRLRLVGFRKGLFPEPWASLRELGELTRENRVRARGVEPLLPDSKSGVLTTAQRPHGGGGGIRTRKTSAEAGRLRIACVSLFRHAAVPCQSSSSASRRRALPLPTRSACVPTQLCHRIAFVHCAPLMIYRHRKPPDSGRRKKNSDMYGLSSCVSRGTRAASSNSPGASGLFCEGWLASAWSRENRQSPIPLLVLSTE